MPVADKTIAQAEAALKMNLFPAVVKYLKTLDFNFEGRASGKTLARVLRPLLFTKAEPLDLSDKSVVSYLTGPSTTMKELKYTQDYCISIYNQLKSAGFPVRRIITGRIHNSGRFHDQIIKLRSKSGIAAFACFQACVIHHIHPDISAEKYLRANYLGVNIRAHSKEHRAYLFSYGKES